MPTVLRHTDRRRLVAWIRPMEREVACLERFLPSRSCFAQSTRYWRCDVGLKSHSFISSMSYSAAGVTLLPLKKKTRLPVGTSMARTHRVLFIPIDRRKSRFFAKEGEPKGSATPQHPQSQPSALIFLSSTAASNSLEPGFAKKRNRTERRFCPCSSKKSPSCAVTEGLRRGADRCRPDQTLRSTSS